MFVAKKAAFDATCSKGLIQRDSAFAEHSFREYSAPTSIDGLPISSLVNIVFYRGITMQSAVKCDSQNRSNYAMRAVNPSRVSKTLNEGVLREVVEIVGHRTEPYSRSSTTTSTYVSRSLSCSVTNSDILQGSQYVAAGDLLALQTPTNVLNYLKKENIYLQKACQVFPNIVLSNTDELRS